MKKYILTSVISSLVTIVLSICFVLIYNANATNKLTLSVGDSTIFGDSTQEKPTDDRTLSAKVLELTLEIDKLNSEITHLNSALNEKLQEITNLNNSNEDKETEILRIRDEIESIQREIDSLNFELTEKNDEIAQLENDNSNLLSTNIDLQSVINELNNTVSSLNQSIEDLQFQVSYYKQLLQEYENIDKLSVSFRVKGESISVQLVSYGERAIVPEDPELDMYDFDYWSIDGTTAVDPYSYTVTEDIVFIAVFTKLYKVRFIVQSEDTTYKTYYNYVRDGEYSLVPDIQYDLPNNMTFVGWSLDGENIIDVNNYPITQDIDFISILEQSSLIQTFSINRDSTNVKFGGVSSPINIYPASSPISVTSSNVLFKIARDGDREFELVDLTNTHIYQINISNLTYTDSSGNVVSCEDFSAVIDRDMPWNILYNGEWNSWKKYDDIYLNLCLQNDGDFAINLFTPISVSENAVQINTFNITFIYDII